MDLLFKRSQTTGSMGRVAFRLFGKAEFSEEEDALIERYRFDEAVLIYAFQPGLIKQSAVRGFGVFLIGWLLFFFMFKSALGSATLAVLVGVGYGFWYFHQNRETIYVRDLIHGRYFTCDSVVDLARKEAWLETICAFLRQVMESAKHWDGEVRNPIEALPKDEARQVIIKGI
ncbi:hypothetical protein [Kordiimonas marina]|uniref:hypothetical protein n=1 Tax=Kordiimonas marina TaxID=2872312 RepID=UPI001FF276EE|nr:hypothetical protein [Kordiimonas marina]MCJ9430736.1 hypothetical protein [Kordiimonas marina]